MDLVCVLLVSAQNRFTFYFVIFINSSLIFADLHTETFLYNFLPFSRGPRMCIGFRFAQVEMKVALSLILRSFSLKLGKEQSSEIQARDLFALKPFPLPVLEISARRKVNIWHVVVYNISVSLYIIRRSVVRFRWVLFYMLSKVMLSKSLFICVNSHNFNNAINWCEVDKTNKIFSIHKL